MGRPNLVTPWSERLRARDRIVSEVSGSLLGAPERTTSFREVVVCHHNCLRPLFINQSKVGRISRLYILCASRL